MSKENVLNILFVDDEVEILEALKRQMSLVEGYNCHFLSNPLEVYELLHNQIIDIIVADVVMPEIDGITLLQDIKIKYPKIVRILLTAYGDYNTSLRAINEAEVFGFITKPWEEDYLLGHLTLASQMLRDQLQETVEGELPLFIVASWDDNREITGLVQTGSNSLMANHLTKRVFMTSAALFGYKYRFQSNRFTLPMVEPNIMVRGTLEREGGMNYGLFIFTPEIDEGTIEQLDRLLDKMVGMLTTTISTEGLSELQTFYNSYISQYM
ncbi:MAG: response regulator [Candidatus Kariarchaeaceae archaeon]|jgi:CheY-like chemotaxis protein